MNRSINRSIKFLLFVVISLFSLAKANAEVKISWEMIQTPSTTQTRRIAVIDQKSFAFTTTTGEIYKTIDAGKNFKKLPSPAKNELSALYFLEDKLAVTSGYGGQIYFSNNGGDSWTKGNSGLKEEGLYSTSYVLDLGKAGNLLYATGIDGDSTFGFFMTSKDNGANWYKTYVPNARITGVAHFFDDFQGETAYLSALSFSGGSLLRTKDGGKSWSLALTSSVQITSVSSSKNYIYAVDVSGKIYKSSNSGNNWDTESLDNSPVLYSIVALNDSTVIIGGEKGSLYVSNNYGKTWIKPGIVANDQELWDIKVAGNSIYVAGNYGKLFKGEIAITNVENEPTVSAETLTLVASKSEVRFNLSSSNLMTLNLFDLTGKEISNISFENSTLRNQKSGVYAYKVKSQTGKEFFGKLIIE